MYAADEEVFMKRNRPSWYRSRAQLGSEGSNCIIINGYPPWQEGTWMRNQIRNSLSHHQFITELKRETHLCCVTWWLPPPVTERSEQQPKDLYQIRDDESYVSPSFSSSRSLCTSSTLDDVTSPYLGVPRSRNQLCSTEALHFCFSIHSPSEKMLTSRLRALLTWHWYARRGKIFWITREGVLLLTFQNHNLSCSIIFNECF